MESVFTDMRWGERARYNFLFNCHPPDGGPRMAAQAGVRAATREGKGDDSRTCLEHMWRQLRKEYGKPPEETQIEKEWETLQQYDPVQCSMRTISQFVEEIKKPARRWEWAHGTPLDEHRMCAKLRGRCDERLRAFLDIWAPADTPYDRLCQMAKDLGTHGNAFLSPLGGGAPSAAAPASPAAAQDSTDDSAPQE